MESCLLRKESNFISGEVEISNEGLFMWLPDIEMNGYENRYDIFDILFR